MGKEFNPQLVDDTAAWLFWTLAAKNGFSRTQQDILDSSGRSVLACAERESIFGSYKINDLPDVAFAEFCGEIAKYTYQKTINEENMIGIVYLEDMKSGRSPSAAEINTTDFNIPLTVSGEQLPSYGMLCIRHPLPAVVIGENEPKSGYFRVENTECLGFDYPMYMTAKTAQRIDSGGWLITGVFHIPENAELARRYWKELVPNSICARDNLHLYEEGGSSLLRFEWGTRKIKNDIPKFSRFSISRFFTRS